MIKEAMQVWAEAFNAWLQQLAQENVQEHTSQALTPADVQASLQLLLAKSDKYKEISLLTESTAKHPNTGSLLKFMHFASTSLITSTHDSLTADSCLVQFPELLLLLSETQARASVCIAMTIGDCFHAHAVIRKERNTRA